MIVAAVMVSLQVDSSVCAYLSLRYDKCHISCLHMPNSTVFFFGTSEPVLWTVTLLKVTAMARTIKQVIRRQCKHPLCNYKVASYRCHFCCKCCFHCFKSENEPKHCKRCKVILIEDEDESNLPVVTYVVMSDSHNYELDVSDDDTLLRRRPRRKFRPLTPKKYDMFEGDIWWALSTEDVKLCD